MDNHVTIHLKLANGKKVDCLRVRRGLSFAILHIYLNTLTPVQAWEFFDDPEGTKKITIYDDGENETVFERFTVLSAVQKSFFEGEENVIMVRLERPYEE